MMRLVLRVLAALCLLVALMSCDGDGHSENDRAGGIVFAAGPDVGEHRPIQGAIDHWNFAHPSEPVRFQSLSPRADDVHSQLLANAQHPDDACYDVLALDVIWTKEFASDGYLVELSRKDAGLLDQPRHLRSAPGTKNGTWAAPFTSDIGRLYYRKKVGPPKSWDAMIRRATPGFDNPVAGSGYGAQLGPYEGLVVNFLERAWAYMNTASSSDRPSLSALRHALNDFQKAVREQAIPARALDDAERDSINSFVAGQSLYMRGWPNVEKELESNTEIKGEWGVAPMPWRSILGGLDLAEGKCSQHRKTATAFIRYMTSAAVQKNLSAGGYLPTRDLPEVAKYGKSLTEAVTRPSLADYAEVSPQIQVIVRAYLKDCLPRAPVPDCRSHTETVARQLDALLR